MTRIEMQIEFSRLLKAISNQLVTNELPNSNTIFQMLSIAQIRYLREVYFKDGSHELILEKADEMRDLTRRVVLDTVPIVTGSMADIASSVDLANATSFMFYIRSDSRLTRTALPTCTNKWMPNEFIKYKDKEDFLTTPIHSPIIVKPGCYIENDGTSNKLIIIHDIYTAITESSGLSLEYIKEPDDVTENNDCELPNFMHEDIVKFAVDIYVNMYKLRLATNNNNNDRSRSS